MELQPILPILALITSGFAWTMGGYVKEWKTKHKDPTWKGFDKKSMRDDLILGAILGVGSVIAAAATNTPLPAITNFYEFAGAVSVGFGFVAMVDKYIVGGLFGKSQ